MDWQKGNDYEGGLSIVIGQREAGAHGEPYVSGVCGVACRAGMHVNYFMFDCMPIQLNVWVHVYVYKS